ncbi:MAG: tetratricopeptide repeat protein [Acidobacteriales bacterium]|nr:tetratricopeptide repeat protein [Terriglobales bacterium]
MQSHTRHQLKQDRFTDATKEAMHWSVEHRNALMIAVIVLLAVVVGGLGYMQYAAAQNEKASLVLADAIRIVNAPIITADQPANPDVKSYATVAERAGAAHDAFLKVANDFPGTANGKYARYLAGVAAMEKGDNAEAEKLLKEVAGYGKDNTALAKMGLAALYRDQNKLDDAARMYREVIALNAPIMPRTTAQLELAQMLEPKQPAEAIKVYEEVLKQEEDARKEQAAKSGTKTTGDATSVLANAATTQKSPLEEAVTKKLAELRGKK